MGRLLTALRPRGDGGAAPPSFAPGDLTDLRVWLDATDASTITEVAGAVSAWTSKDPLARVFNKAGTTLTTGSVTLNSLNTLAFAGAHLTTADTNATWNFLHSGTRHAIWAVCRFTTATAFYGLIGSNGTTSAANGNSVYHDNSGRIIHQISRNVSDQFTVSNNSGNSFFAADTFALLEVIADGANATAADRSEIRRNNGTAKKNSSVTHAWNSENATRAFQIGAAGNNAGPMTGGIAELVIAVSPTAGELTSMRTYLADKWGLTIA